MQLEPITYALNQKNALEFVYSFQILPAVTSTFPSPSKNRLECNWGNIIVKCLIHTKKFKTLGNLTLLIASFICIVYNQYIKRYKPRVTS